MSKDRATGSPRKNGHYAPYQGEISKKAKEANLTAFQVNQLAEQVAAFAALGRAVQELVEVSGSLSALGLDESLEGLLGEVGDAFGAEESDDNASLTLEEQLAQIDSLRALTVAGHEAEKIAAELAVKGVEHDKHWIIITGNLEDEHKVGGCRHALAQVEEIKALHAKLVEIASPHEELWHSMRDDVSYAATLTAERETEIHAFLADLENAGNPAFVVDPAQHEDPAADAAWQYPSDQSRLN